MRTGCGVSTTPARPQRFGITAHTAAYGERWLPYEDEIRSVERSEVDAALRPTG